MNNKWIVSATFSVVLLVLPTLRALSGEFPVKVEILPNPAAKGEAVLIKLTIANNTKDTVEIFFDPQDPSDFRFSSDSPLVELLTATARDQSTGSHIVKAGESYEAVVESTRLFRLLKPGSAILRYKLSITYMIGDEIYNLRKITADGALVFTSK